MCDVRVSPLGINDANAESEHRFYWVFTSLERDEPPIGRTLNAKVCWWVHTIRPSGSRRKPPAISELDPRGTASDPIPIDRGSS